MFTRPKSLGSGRPRPLHQHHTSWDRRWLYEHLHRCVGSTAACAIGLAVAIVDKAEVGGDWSVHDRRIVSLVDSELP